MNKLEDLKDENNLNTLLKSIFARANPENPNEITNPNQLKFLMNMIAQERNLQNLTDDDAKELYKEIKPNNGNISVEEFKIYFKELL